MAEENYCFLVGRKVTLSDQAVPRERQLESHVILVSGAYPPVLT